MDQSHQNGRHQGGVNKSETAKAAKETIIEQDS
jgi:hypothetical protein